METVKPLKSETHCMTTNILGECLQLSDVT